MQQPSQPQQPVQLPMGVGQPQQQGGQGNASFGQPSGGPQGGFSGQPPVAYQQAQITNQTQPGGQTNPQSNLSYPGWSPPTSAIPGPSPNQPLTNSFAPPNQLAPVISGQQPPIANTSIQPNTSSQPLPPPQQPPTMSANPPSTVPSGVNQNPMTNPPASPQKLTM